MSEFLRDAYGLERGVDTILELRPGLGPAEVDADLSVGRFPPGESRFVQSWNRLDNGGPYPLAPAEARLDLCTFEGESCPQDVLRLLRVGATAEDNPNVRASHHFHDPVKEHGPPLGNSPPVGNQGLDNRGKPYYGWLLGAGAASLTAVFRGGGLFTLVGRSARDRALDLPLEESFPSESDPRNFFSLADAERYLHLALASSRDDERSHAMGLHFLAVGAALHLIEDMTSPAHVRNDFLSDHVLPEVTPDSLTGIALESAGDSERFGRFIRDSLGGGRDLSPSLPLAQLPLTVRPGYDSQIPLLAPSGFDAVDFWEVLTARVNSRFFSRATVDDRPFVDGKVNPPGYWSPAVPPCAVEGETDETANGGIASRTFTRRLPERNLVTGQLEQGVGGALVTGLFVSSSLVPHLARCPDHAVPPPGAQVGDRGEWLATVIDPSVQRDYLEILSPLAVDAAEKFLRFYFAPRLEVVPRELSASPDERTGSFRLSNRSSLPLAFPADAIEVVYEGLDGSRHRAPVNCGGGPEGLTLAPAPAPGESGPPSAFVCELPGELPEGARPINRGDFWVVVRGALGARGVVASAAEYDEGTADFVVAFDHVRGDEIVYGGETIVGDMSLPPGPARDAARQLDVFAVEIDPTRELGDAPPVRRNLTEAVRAQATDDFTLPVPMPFGDVIALRTDLGLPAQYDDLRAQEGLFFDVARLEPSEEGAPVVTPLNLCVEGAQGCVPSRTRSEIGASGWLDWSRDGRFLFFYVGGLENDLYRHDTLAGHAHQVSPYQGADPLLTEPPEGYEREFCRALEWGSFSARSESELAVTVTCHRNRVTVVRGPNDFDTEPLQDGWDVFSTLLIPEPLVTAGMILESAPAKRLRLGMEPLRVDDCGGGPVCGATEDDDFEMFPVWSPDGTKLALLRLRGEPLSSSRVDPSFDFIGRELYVADVYQDAPTGIRKILELPEGEGFIVTPTWSPGGEWIAFGIEGGPHPGEVYVVRTDGEESQAPRRVTKGAGVVDRLVWRATTPLLLP